MQKRLISLFLAASLAVTLFLGMALSSQAASTIYSLNDSTAITGHGWASWQNALNVIPSDPEYDSLRASGTPYAILKETLDRAKSLYGEIADGATTNYDSVKTSTGETLTAYADGTFGAQFYMFTGGKQLAYDLWNSSVDSSVKITTVRSNFFMYVTPATQTVYNQELYTAAINALGEYLTHCQCIEAFGSSDTGRYEAQVQRFKNFKAALKEMLPNNGIYEVSDYKPSGKVPLGANKIFAGWYTDETCTTPYMLDSGEAYAKFVDENVLSVRVQCEAGLTANKEDTNLRFITTVDGKDYRAVGFKITLNGGKEIKLQTSTVYSSITATNGQSVITYSPTAFSSESKYFMTFVISKIPNEFFVSEFKVTPYWITIDGSTVEGLSKTFTITDANGFVKAVAVDNTTKVYQDIEYKATTATKRVSMSLASNESEGGQFVLSNQSKAFNVTDITVSDLTDGNGNVIPSSAFEIYRQHYMYIDVHYYTYTGYPNAYYPDALINIAYDKAHYPNGFPVAKGQNQGYWITLTADKGTVAGDYTGKVTVTTNYDTVEIPLSVRIYDFTLTDESHFKTSFALYQLTDYDGQREQYYEFLKKYRLNSTYLPTIEADLSWNEDKNSLVTLDATKAAVKYAQTDVIQTVMLDIAGGRRYNLDGKYTFTSQFKEMLTYLNGQIPGKLYTMIADEPVYQEGPDWATTTRIPELATLVRNEGQGMKSIITYDTYLPTDTETLSIPDVWCVKPTYITKADADAAHARGQEMWYYTCNWPVYPAITTHIDSHLIAPRLLTWLGFGDHIDGFFCYSATRHDRATNDTHTDANEWINPYAHLLGDDSGNTANSDPAGDNYMIMIGLEGDGIIDENVPVPTLRLEAFRDGMEDYEYLWLYTQKIEALNKELGTNVSADDVTEMFTTVMYNGTENWLKDTSVFAYVRNDLAEKIAEDVGFIYYIKETGNDATRTIHVYGANTSTVTINGQSVPVSGGHAQLTVNVDTSLTRNDYSITVGAKTVQVHCFPGK